MTVVRHAAIALLASLAAWASPLKARAQRPAGTNAGRVHGIVVDSVRGRVLAGAFVALLPTAREVVADSAGAFHFDSVAPNATYRLRVQHALIDTLGISLTTPPFVVDPGGSANVDAVLPSAQRIVTSLCTAAQLTLGPAALVGFVRDPETSDVIDSLTLSLVYDESPVRTAQFLVTRVSHPDAAGHYVICGLPMGKQGRLLITRSGIALADIPIQTEADSPLSTRSLGVTRDVIRMIASNRRAASAVRLMHGEARVEGRVITKAGLPVAGAHVQMDGTQAAAVTRTDGGFVLDSVPVGTQSLSVRKLGYAPTDAAVDVVATENARIVVTMSDYVPTLAPVITVARRTQDLEAVGFTRRRERGIGVFREGDEIDKGPTDLGESLRMIPGLHIAYDANSQSSQKTLIMSSRDANECVNIIIDGIVWQDASSSIEEYVRPEEIEALEMYHSASVPGEFVVPGKSTCAVLVLWTKRRIHAAPRSP